MWIRVRSWDFLTRVAYGEPTTIGYHPVKFDLWVRQIRLLKCKKNEADWQPQTWVESHWFLEAGSKYTNLSWNTTHRPRPNWQQ